MKKLSKVAFCMTIRILLAGFITSICGWLMYWAIGYGREIYHTSTPEELYGAFGWFKISYYFGNTAFVCVALIFLLMATGSIFFEIQEPNGGGDT